MTDLTWKFQIVPVKCIPMLWGQSQKIQHVVGTLTVACMPLTCSKLPLCKKHSVAVQIKRKNPCENAGEALPHRTINYKVQKYSSDLTR